MVYLCLFRLDVVANICTLVAGDDVKDLLKVQQK